MKDKVSESNLFEELADITEYTEATADISEASGDSEEDENFSFRDSFSKEGPIAAGTLPENNNNSVSAIAVKEDGTMVTCKDPSIVHFIVKRSASKHNPGLYSIFIKLIECQHLPEVSEKPPNAFVEVWIGTQLYISAVESSDKNPVFTEEYWL